MLQASYNIYIIKKYGELYGLSLFHLKSLVKKMLGDIGLYLTFDKRWIHAVRQSSSNQFWLNFKTKLFCWLLRFSYKQD